MIHTWCEMALYLCTIVAAVMDEKLTLASSDVINGAWRIFGLLSWGKDNAYNEAGTQSLPSAPGRKPNACLICYHISKN